MKKATIKKNIEEYFDNHPRLSRNMDKFFNATDKFMFFYTVILTIVLIAIPTIVFYFLLEESIRDTISPIIGAIFSVIIIPLTLNYLNSKKDITTKRFEINKNMYINLSNIIISLIKNKSFSQESSKELKGFLKENYGKMCVSMPTDFISDVYLIVRECDNGNYENVLYYSEKCLKKIRKQCGLTKDFYISGNIINMIRNEDENN